jgi:putative tricarboxylic transport membrane protein
MLRFRPLAALALLTLSATGAEAQQSFYAGKQITILVNYDAGGPTDFEARLMARHLGKHLAGHPNFIIQNMGGAAGLIGAKYLGEVATKDGSMMGYFTGTTQRYVSNPERFNVDFRTYEFIAVVPSGRIHFMRTDVKPGIHKPADIVKSEDLVLGGLGREQPKDMSMRLTLDLLGVRYKYVTGYNASARAMLALQRGEVSYYADSPPLYKSKVVPLIEAGTLLPVFYDPGFNGVEFSVPSYAKGLPVKPFQELYQEIKGTMPSGPLWDAYKSLLTVNGTMYRLVTLPPGAPREAVDALRRAVVQLNEDKEYIAEAERTMGEAPEYVSSPDLNDQVRKGLSISPDLKAFMEDYVKKAEK